MNIRIDFEYDGSEFMGYQRQPKMRTVQGELEKVISSVLGSEISLNASGRTDKGVHALMQVATFSYDGGVPSEKMAWLISRRLPSDIRIQSLTEVDDSFHARYSAKGKTYVYKIKREVSVFESRYCHVIEDNLDLDKMRRAASYLTGEHDFTSFSSFKSDKESKIRNVSSLTIEWGDETLEIRITSDGFLYNMVRIIAAYLINVGTGKIDPDKTNEVILSRSKDLTRQVAPAAGLYLEKVYY